MAKSKRSNATVAKRSKRAVSGTPRATRKQGHVPAAVVGSAEKTYYLSMVPVPGTRPSGREGWIYTMAARVGASGEVVESREYTATAARKAFYALIGDAMANGFYVNATYVDQSGGGQRGYYAPDGQEYIDNLDSDEALVLAPRLGLPVTQTAKVAKRNYVKNKLNTHRGIVKPKTQKQPKLPKALEAFLATVGARPSAKAVNAYVDSLKPAQRKALLAAASKPNLGGAGLTPAIVDRIAKRAHGTSAKPPRVRVSKPPRQPKPPRTGRKRTPKQPVIPVIQQRPVSQQPTYPVVQQIRPLAQPVPQPAFVPTPERPWPNVFVPPQPQPQFDSPEWHARHPLVVTPIFGGPSTVIPTQPMAPIPQYRGQPHDRLIGQPQPARPFNPIAHVHVGDSPPPRRGDAMARGMNLLKDLLGK